jgi:hypothetical protein
MIRVVHPGSRIRMLTFYPSRIPDPRSRGQKGTGSRIRIRNTAEKTIIFMVPIQIKVGSDSTVFLRGRIPYSVQIRPDPQHSLHTHLDT